MKQKLRDFEIICPANRTLSLRPGLCASHVFALQFYGEIVRTYPVSISAFYSLP